MHAFVEKQAAQNVDRFGNLRRGGGALETVDRRQNPIGDPRASRLELVAAQEQQLQFFRAANVSNLNKELRSGGW